MEKREQKPLQNYLRTFIRCPQNHNPTTEQDGAGGRRKLPKRGSESCTRMSPTPSPSVPMSSCLLCLPCSPAHYDPHVPPSASMFPCVPTFMSPIPQVPVPSMCLLCPLMSPHLNVSMPPRPRVPNSVSPCPHIHPMSRRVPAPPMSTPCPHSLLHPPCPLNPASPHPTCPPASPVSPHPPVPVSPRDPTLPLSTCPVYPYVPGVPCPPIPCPPVSRVPCPPVPIHSPCPHTPRVPPCSYIPHVPSCLHTPHTLRIPPPRPAHASPGSPRPPGGAVWRGGACAARWAGPGGSAL